jgi:hypothetical protein
MMRIQERLRILLLLLAAAFSRPATVVAFLTVGAPSCGISSSSSSSLLWAASRSSASSTTKSTLTEETVWKLSVVLRGVETRQGKRVNDISTLQVNFIEEDGYEPPQGTVQQVLRGGAAEDNNTGREDRLVISSGRWKLSEDPNDRKDGLWVWGLFKEPLYPFMLLQMETQAIPLPGTRGGSSQSNDDAEETAIGNDAIKPLTLYAQINHKRDDKLGVVLEASDLNVRQVETIKADPFGAAKVDIYEDVSVGTITIQPIRTKI